MEVGHRMLLYGVLLGHRSRHASISTETTVSSKFSSRAGRFFVRISARSYREDEARQQLRRRYYRLSDGIRMIQRDGDIVSFYPSKILVYPSIVYSTGNILASIALINIREHFATSYRDQNFSQRWKKIFVTEKLQISFETIPRIRLFKQTSIPSFGSINAVATKTQDGRTLIKTLQRGWNTRKRVVSLRFSSSFDEGKRNPFQRSGKHRDDEQAESREAR